MVCRPTSRGRRRDVGTVPGQKSTRPPWAGDDGRTGNGRWMILTPVERGCRRFDPSYAGFTGASGPAIARTTGPAHVTFSFVYGRLVIPNAPVRGLAAEVRPLVVEASRAARRRRNSAIELV